MYYIIFSLIITDSIFSAIKEVVCKFLFFNMREYHYLLLIDQSLLKKIHIKIT